MKNIYPVTLAFLLLLVNFDLSSQHELPHVHPWHGDSESLILDKDSPWITHVELKDFKTTPDYEETNEWFKTLADSSQLISIKNIGVSAQHRPIKMVIASKEQALHQGALTRVKHPVVLVQAGIHSGEIDGKDAGMMLLRDICFYQKSSLLDSVNLLFIPILAVDAHEKASSYNRPNQRGPENMGWRTNARNLNLNRDYTKHETEGIRAISYIINKYDPVLYVDLHVTDGADYQYDITYGRPSNATYSKSISEWLRSIFSKEVDAALEKAGHIPGPLIFTFQKDDFSKGIIKYAMPLRFSDGYGDARQLPSVLVENHSLKPYKQRVLGTYIFMEQMLKTVATNYDGLRMAINKDRNERPDSIPLAFWVEEGQMDSIELKLIVHKTETSDITGNSYTSWDAEPVVRKVPFIKMEKPTKITKIPKAYYIPLEWIEVIKKLSGHGIEMEILEKDFTGDLDYYYVEEFEIKPNPTEGKFQFKSVSFSKKSLKRTIPKGSVRISTDQALGRLAVLLLDPNAPDSFFQWGYFNQVLNRTEYIEAYVLEPMIIKMIENDQNLKSRFEEKKIKDPDFSKNPREIYQWFYAQTPYFDKDWKVIPVGIEY